MFFNDLKPGIHILKVDSETLKPLPNAVFRVESIGGSFSKEFSTDKHGEADLSQLEPGAYLIRETKAPDGYIADGRVRTVQLVAGKDAEFVFTDSKKPSLVIVKYDPDSGEYLAGASFRIAKIEDGSHYLDRITDTQGRVLISDLDPGVSTALGLVGKVNYFWGGKSSASGWDGRWGVPTKVWADGSSTSGTYRPYGLDCTGFLDWTLRNAGLPSDGQWHIGANLTEVTAEEAQPGDIALNADNSHVGMAVGRDEGGELLVCHCSAVENGVVVSGCEVGGFVRFGRSAVYGG